MTQTGSIMGTAQYLSPEQAQGHAVSAPSDLYSIGIILYEMLTGRVPFEGESAVTIALKQVGEAPLPPSVLNPAVPPALEAVVLRALEKDPARRFADADEFIAALEGAARGVAPAPAVVGAAVTEATQIVRPYETAPVVPIPPPAVYQEPPPPAQYFGPPPPPEPPGEGGGAGRWWIALLIGLLVAALLIGGLLIFNKEKVKVPNVVGVPQAEAELTLKRKGLSTDLTQKESPDRPKGTVIGQDPAGGSRVGRGDVVTLVISAGPGTAQIPDLTGRPRSAALKTLHDLGFKTTEERTTSDTITQNKVIETRPGAGEQRDKGTSVAVVISSGMQRVAVPKVTDLPEADARSTLEALGFQVATTPREDTTHDPGTVLAQAPAVGTTLPKGAKVTLTIAKEPKPVDVPDVTGQGQNAATQALKHAGFKVVVVPQPTGTRSENRHVLKQDPPNGQAKKGSTVTISVGAFDPALSQPPGTGGTGGAGPSSATPPVPAP
jgi:serine/threonine-protein kinase